MDHKKIQSNFYPISSALVYSLRTEERRPLISPSWKFLSFFLTSFTIHITASPEFIFLSYFKKIKKLNFEWNFVSAWYQTVSRVVLLLISRDIYLKIVNIYLLIHKSTKILKKWLLMKFRLIFLMRSTISNKNSSKTEIAEEISQK